MDNGPLVAQATIGFQLEVLECRSGVIEGLGSQEIRASVAEKE
jgi:hypothetical protein